MKPGGETELNQRRQRGQLSDQVRGGLGQDEAGVEPAHTVHFLSDSFAPIMPSARSWSRSLPLAPPRDSRALDTVPS